MQHGSIKAFLAAALGASAMANALAAEANDVGMAAPSSARASSCRPTAEFAVAVSAERASFFFPADTEGTWRWNIADVPASNMEYGWVADVTNGNAGFELGYMRFKPGSPAAEKLGTFADLLAAGQLSLAERTQNSFSVRPANVTATETADGLIVVLVGRKDVDRLFSTRPLTVAMSFICQGHLSIEKAVPVHYVSPAHPQ